MVIKVSGRVNRIQPSPTLAVSAKADELIAAGKDVISLSVGEPDFDTPQFIKQAAVDAIWGGLTKYTAVEGTLSLRKAIADKFQRENKLAYTPAQILVSCGAKHSIFNLFAALLNAEDEVIIPTPYWVSYPDIAKMVDATPVIIETTFEQKFKLTPAQLEAAITPKTRLIMLNSPSNPTGIAYSNDELKALGQVLAKHPDICIASDDIYEHTLWDKTQFSNILMACPELYDRCIIINGVSKAYAMTGWRIGFAAGPQHIIAAMKKIQSQSTSNPNSIAQAATIAALNGDQSCIQTMTKAYKERHDYVVSELKKIPGVKVLPCDGTFYSFPNFEEIIERSTLFKNDIELAEYLLHDAGIALIPGSAFGAPGYLRISYATSMEKLEKAMSRLQNAIQKSEQQCASTHL